MSEEQIELINRDIKRSSVAISVYMVCISEKAKMFISTLHRHKP